MLRRYGISQWFIDRIHALNDQATASGQINGTLTGPISIQSGIRHVCLLSMVMYTLSTPPHSFAGGKSARITDWKISVVCTGPSLCGRFYGFCLLSCCLRYDTSGHTVLWTDCRSSSSPHKTLSAGYKRVDGTCDGTRDWFPRASWHLRGNIRPPPWLSPRGTAGPVSYELCALKRGKLILEPVLSPENTLRPAMPACKNLVWCANFPANPRTCPASHGLSLMVNPAGHYLPGSCNYHSTSKTRRRLGPPESWGQMQIAPLHQDSDVRRQERICNLRAYAHLGLHGHTAGPASRP